MKKQRSVGIIIILLVFIISSCTLTKRHYQPGYHVEWHIGKRASNSEPKQINEIELISVQESEPYNSEIDEPIFIASENSNLHKDEIIVNSKNNDLPVQQINDKNSDSDIKLLGEESLNSVDDPEPILHWTAGTSLGLGILGFFVPFFPCIAAIIFGIVALNKINSEPGKFKGRGMAIAGIVLGIVGIFYIIGIAILMFMAFL